MKTLTQILALSLVLSFATSAPVHAAQEDPRSHWVTSFCKKHFKILVLSGVTAAAFVASYPIFQRLEEDTRAQAVMQKMSPDNLYTPEMPSPAKYLEIYRLRHLGYLVPVSLRQNLIQAANARGIPVPDFLQEPSKSGSHFVWGWIARYDPDPRARELARELNSPKAHDYTILAKYFGETLPGYTYSWSEEQKLKALKSLADAGMNDKKRWGLVPIDQTDLEMGYKLTPGASLAYYLRTVPGFLESVKGEVSSAEDWLEKALDNQQGHFGDLVSRLAGNRKDYIYVSPQFGDLIVARLSPEEIGSFLEEKKANTPFDSAIEKRVHADPRAYVSIFRGILKRDLDAHSTREALQILALVPELRDPLAPEIKHLLDNAKSSKVQTAAAQILVGTGLLSEAEILDRLEKTKNEPEREHRDVYSEKTASPLCIALTMVIEKKKQISDENRASVVANIRTAAKQFSDPTIRSQIERTATEIENLGN